MGDGSDRRFGAWTPPFALSTFLEPDLTGCAVDTRTTVPSGH